MRKSCISWHLVGTAPRLKREIEKKERARGQKSKRAKENVKMRRWDDEKISRCEDEKMWRCEDVKMWGCEDVKMRRCEDVRMWRWEDVKMRRCEDEKMWRWAGVKMGEDVKMRRCEDEQMWRWEDVQMWGWEDVKIWRCYAKMWRCENVWQTPTIRRTLRSDALVKKKWGSKWGLGCLISKRARKPGWNSRNVFSSRSRWYISLFQMANWRSSPSWHRFGRLESRHIHPRRLEALGEQRSILSHGATQQPLVNRRNPRTGQVQVQFPL